MGCTCKEDWITKLINFRIKCQRNKNKLRGKTVKVSGTVYVNQGNFCELRLYSFTLIFSFSFLFIRINQVETWPCSFAARVKLEFFLILNKSKCIYSHLYFSLPSLCGRMRAVIKHSKREAENVRKRHNLWRCSKIVYF